MLIQKYLIRLKYQKKGGSTPMKKKFAVTLAVVIALGITTMYTYPHIAAGAFTSATFQSKTSSYALEGVDVISENDTNETETKYSVYKTYGMTYDKEKDRFFYEGKMVRFFKDDIGGGNLNSFFYSEGVIDVLPIRNAEGILTGLKKASDEDFAARTKKEKELKKGIEDSQKNISGKYDSFEGGEPDYKNDSIRDVYAPYGVTYDAFSGAWLFKGKIIHFLQDEGQATYCDNSESAIANGINIEVIRSKNGKIKTLKVRD